MPRDQKHPPRMNEKAYNKNRCNVSSAKRSPRQPSQTVALPRRTDTGTVGIKRRQHHRAWLHGNVGCTEMELWCSITAEAHRASSQLQTHRRSGNGQRLAQRPSGRKIAERQKLEPIVEVSRVPQSCHYDHSKVRQ